MTAHTGVDEQEDVLVDDDDVPHDHSWLHVGTRLAPGPSFAFASGSNRRLTDADRARIGRVLAKLAVVDGDGDDDQVSVGALAAWPAALAK